MSQQLKALDAIAEDVDLIYNTHMTAHNSLYLQLKGSLPSSSFHGKCTHTRHIHICRENTPVHKLKVKQGKTNTFPPLKI